MARLSTIKQEQGSLTPAGIIMDLGGSSLPSRTVLCDGSSYDSVTNPEYAQLFVAIGTTYGGTGADDFNVPDLRGRVTAGRDDMGGVAANRITSAGAGFDGSILGVAGGNQTHTLSTAELAGHNHSGSSLSMTDDGHWHHIARSGAPAYVALTNTTFLAEGINGSPSYDYALSGQGSSPNIGRTNTDTHSHTVSGSTGSSGSGNAHQNTQPTLITNKVITY